MPEIAYLAAIEADSVATGSSPSVYVAPPSLSQHVERLVKAIPELEPALEEHLGFHGELLSHVLYGDVTRWFVGACSTDRQRAIELAMWLDGEYSAGDELVRNLIAVSFLENLPWPPDVDSGRIARILGPVLRQELREMKAWRLR